MPQAFLAVLGNPFNFPPFQPESFGDATNVENPITNMLKAHRMLLRQKSAVGVESHLRLRFAEKSRDNRRVLQAVEWYSRALEMFRNSVFVKANFAVNVQVVFKSLRAVSWGEEKKKEGGGGRKGNHK